MKNLMVLFLIAIFGLLSFFPATNATFENQTAAPSQRGKKTPSPIDGSWELVSTEVAGKTTYHNKPKQFKMFHDGFMSLMMYDDSGKFEAAGAGPFEIDGNKYKETFTYSSWPEGIGMSVWFEWAMKDDTLLFYGFKKAVMADGKDVTNEWGGDTFIEKRVRAKK